VTIGAAVVSLGILAAWFPFNALYHQRAALAGAAAELSQLHRQDAALAQERKNLSDSTEIARIAREQYQLVTSGQQAYEVLPPSGSSKGGAPYAGDPALTAPVAPSANAVLPPGAGDGSSTSTSSTSQHHGATSSSASSSSSSGRGFFGRVVGALEFWR
jgi:hypothetical protein